MKSLIALILLALSLPALADTGLWMSCASPEVAAGASLPSCPQLTYTAPTAATLVASSTLDAPTWAAPESQWRPYGALPAGTKGVRCAADITANTSFTAGTSANDPCPSTSKSWSSFNPTSAPTTARWVVTWTAPAKGLDNTGKEVLLAPGDIVSWRLHVWPESGGPGTDIDLPPSATTYTVSAPAVRTCFGLTAEGKEVWGDASDTLCLDPPARPSVKPGKPTMTVTVSVTFP